MKIYFDKPCSGCVGDKCQLGTWDAITINGIDGDGAVLDEWGEMIRTEPTDVVGYGGVLNVVTRFFGTADKNTGPLRKVTVNWGKDARQPAASLSFIEGRLKNHLGIKPDNTSMCDDADFSRSKDRACTDQYFQFTTIYFCPRGGAGLPACAGTPDDTGCFANTCPVDVQPGEGRGSCCVFKPKVQLKDNWPPAWLKEEAFFIKYQTKA